MNDVNHKNFIAYMLKLDEVAFFALTRNYLGPKPSPFNRTKIAEEFALYLLSDAVQEKMEEYLDFSDLQYLSIINHYKTTHLPLFKAFFMLENGHSIAHKLDNLQERMLVFYNPQQASYYLNPLLSNFFSKQNLSINNLFCYQASSSTANPFWLTPNQLTAYLSIKQHNLLHMAINLNEAQLLMLDRATQKIGLINSRGLNPARLEEFAALPFDQQLAYLAAGYATGQPDEQQNLVEVITHLFCNYHDKVIDVALLGRIYYLCCNDIMHSNIITQLQSFGLWTQNGQLIALKNLPTTHRAEMLLEADASCYLMPQQAFCAALPAAFKLEHYDIVSHYIISRETFFKALASGYRADSLIKALERDGFKTISESFKVNITHWQQLYQSAQLFHGYFLQLTPDKNRLAKACQWLDPYLEQEISEGCYLLKEPPSSAFYAMLNKIGCLSVSVTEARPVAPMIIIADHHLKARLTINPSMALPSYTPPNLTHADSEMDRRIKRKIIFFEGQLNDDKRHVESVNGFDFQGKMRLIKSAISRHLDLEIEMVNDIDVVKLYVTPLSIKKVDDIYMLIALNHHTNQKIRGSIKTIASVTLVRPTLIN